MKNVDFSTLSSQPVGPSAGGNRNVVGLYNMLDECGTDASKSRIVDAQKAEASSRSFEAMKIFKAAEVNHVKSLSVPGVRHLNRAPDPHTVFTKNAIIDANFSHPIRGVTNAQTRIGLEKSAKAVSRREPSRNHHYESDMSNSSTLINNDRSSKIDYTDHHNQVSQNKPANRTASHISRNDFHSPSTYGRDEPYVKRGHDNDSPPKENKAGRNVVPSKSRRVEPTKSRVSTTPPRIVEPITTKLSPIPSKPSQQSPIKALLQPPIGRQPTPAFVNHRPVQMPNGARSAWVQGDSRLQQPVRAAPPPMMDLDQLIEATSKTNISARPIDIQPDRRNASIDTLRYGRAYEYAPKEQQKRMNEELDDNVQKKQRIDESGASILSQKELPRCGTCKRRRIPICIGNPCCGCIAARLEGKCRPSTERGYSR
ncbi:hypothetical protein BC829DRAFT_236350 [Chytridium lagenaria]|nr:hypothetical protein BC829DRAFT_236350 [Chytridium lagenaria]